MMIDIFVLYYLTTTATDSSLEVIYAFDTSGVYVSRRCGSADFT